MKCNYESCNKKIKKIMMITCKCRCNNYYCLKHNLPELHDCTYDYNTNEDKENFIKNNKIIKQKISII